MDTKTEWLVGIAFWVIVYLLLTWHRDEIVIENTIFEKVNELRVDVGAPPLTRSSELNTLAKAHSTRMENESFFEHSSDNVGENIVESPVWYWTTGCGITVTNYQIARCMVKGWKESVGHYANMVESDYSVTGVGISCSFFECKGTQNFS